MLECYHQMEDHGFYVRYIHKACYTTTGLLAVPTQTTGVQAVPIRAGATSRQVAC